MKSAAKLSPRAHLERMAARAREMHRLYPFTYTVSSVKVRKRRGR